MTYPDIPFTDGQIWSPDLAYLAFHQSYGDSLDLTVLGNHPGITDAQLSTTGVVNTVALITDGLKPTVSSGLVVNVASGYLLQNPGNLVLVNSTNVTVPDNSTTYVYIAAGTATLTVDTIIPAVSTPIAKVVSSGGVITLLTDLRQSRYRRMVVNPDVTMVFGGQSTTDKTCTAGEVFDQGIYYYRNFTVPSGVSITVDKYAVIKCSGRLTVSGTINVTAAIPGGIEISGNNYNLGTGVYIFPRKGFGLGAYGTYAYGLQPYGSGGDTGTIYINTGSAAPTSWITGRGGRGGGGLVLQAALGVDVYGTINCNGGNATNPSITGSSSWAISGCAGGTGGCVSISSPTSVILRAGSVVNVSGGNGGNAAISTGYVVNAGSGGGGAGGVVVLQAPSGAINTTGSTVNVAGGTAGSFVQQDPGNLGNTLSGSVGSSFMTSGGISHVTGSAPTGSAGQIYILNYLPLG